MPIYTGNSTVNTTISSTYLNLSTPASVPAGANGRMYYSNTDGRIKSYTSGAWRGLQSVGNTWLSFYDFRGASSATSATRYDDGNSLVAAATATYSNASLVRRTATVSGYACAGIGQGYTAALNYARMERTTGLSAMTLMQVHYRATGFYGDVSGGMLAYGMNFGNATWNVQTDSYRDGSNGGAGDGWAFSTGGGYGSGTRQRGTAWPTNSVGEIYVLFSVYNGADVRRYINIGNSINTTPYITITPGTGNITYYGILDAMSYGGNYSDGTTFMSCTAVWGSVLTTTQMQTLVDNRYKLASDTSFYGDV